MCKRLTAAYLDRIGSRPVGWCLFNGKDYSFLSEKQVKTKIQQGILVNGLKLDAEENVVIDTEFTRNLMAKSGLTFQPIIEAEDDEVSVMNKYYALVQVEKTDADTTYRFITNRCGCEVFTEQKLKSLLEIMEFGGVKLSETGDLLIHSGIEVKDSRQTADKLKTADNTKAEVKSEVKKGKEVENPKQTADKLKTTEADKTGDQQAAGKGAK